MDCATTRFLLTAFVDGEVGDFERRQIARHLAFCPRCAARLQTLSKLRALLRARGPREAVPEDLLQRIARREAPAAAAWRRWSRPGAMTVALLAFVLPVVADSGARRPTPDSPLSEAPVHRVVRGRFVCLPCALREQLGAPAAASDDPSHQPALRAVDGQVWILLNRPACPEELPPGEVAVSGRFFPASHLLAADNIH
jgi:anti-sigma factor (TIGR02949 family)